MVVWLLTNLINLRGIALVDLPGVGNTIYGVVGFIAFKIDYHITFHILQSCLSKKLLLMEMTCV